MVDFIVLLLLAYIVLSYLLLRYPHLLHAVRLRAFTARHISHRGGAGERTENTMEAFTHAVYVGTDMLELDCHLTKDEEVVVLHDGDLKRGTSRDLKISSLNYSELPKYRSKLEVEFDPGNFYESTLSDNRCIPRLRDLFVAFPHIPMNIDIKVDCDCLIAKVADLVREFDREKITVWGSFSSEVSSKCKTANPNIPRFFPLSEVLWMIFAYYIGLLPFLPLSHEYLELPLASAFDTPRIRKAYGLDNWRKRTLLWIVDFLLMSPRLIQHLKARGIPVIFWVCNTEPDFECAYQVGAEGVMTDYPTRLSAYLALKIKNRSNQWAVTNSDKTKLSVLHRSKCKQQAERCRNARTIRSARSSGLKMPAFQVFGKASMADLRMVGD